MNTCCDEFCSSSGCVQGRGCPVRTTPLHTRNGGKQVDTDTEDSVWSVLAVAIGVPLLMVLIGWALS